MRTGVVGLPCREHGEGGFRATEIKHATLVGGNMLVVTDAREVVAEFVVAATEALGRGEALEAAHTSDASAWPSMNHGGRETTQDRSSA